MAPQNKTAEFKLIQELEVMQKSYKLVYENLHYSQKQNQARQKPFKKLRNIKRGDVIYYIKAFAVLNIRLTDNRETNGSSELSGPIF